MAATEVLAPAKINLTLHVTGQRDDGYHLLDSLVVFADVGDVLRISDGPQMALSVDGPFAAGVPADERNLVWRAAQMCGASCEMHLTKTLPHGAGIGGGSSDAAAVLRHFNRPDLALRLGADVPVCLGNKPQRMRGIGEVLEPVASLPAFHLVLVTPPVHVSTPAVFRALERKSNPPMSDLPATVDADWVRWLAGQRNDLEAAARTVASEIGQALDALSDALLARMSGSGGTCFGIYETAEAAQVAARRIAQAHPDWWVCATRSLGSGVS